MKVGKTCTFVLVRSSFQVSVIRVLGFGVCGVIGFRGFSRASRAYELTRFSVYGPHSGAAFRTRGSKREG